MVRLIANNDTSAQLFQLTDYLTGSDIDGPCVINSYTIFEAPKGVEGDEYKGIWVNVSSTGGVTLDQTTLGEMEFILKYNISTPIGIPDILSSNLFNVSVYCEDLIFINFTTPAFNMVIDDSPVDQIRIFNESDYLTNKSIYPTCFVSSYSLMEVQDGVVGKKAFNDSWLAVDEFGNLDWNNAISGS